ncbi:vacuolar protein 8-like isoform X1 [Macadamia integrifolia]|uniref:vacuolar protein 8-like isoform X1 n=1 Tax=Macadamia integrifolia TaxID=60698 RepID=UPI001C52A2A4|nr:vacuolar protein 8-like isoform X1 [Macadamia integrifolia]
MRREMGEDRGVSEEQKRHTTQEGCTGESNLRKAIQRISSLISLSHSIKVFPVKWQLIRKKLEELNSGLTAAEKCDLGENSKFSELIPSIEMTLNDCNDLARRCVDLSYSGKLLMQSDLDMICVKFQLNIKNLAGIYTAGILTNALVVSKPGIGACRDDMKFYVRDLLTRLKIGDFEMKSHALVALNEVVSEDEKCVRIVIETGEIISLLVNFLEFPEIGIQEESAKAISVVAGFDTCRNLLVGAGIIAPLIRVLEGGTDLGKERAARALQKLTENSENAWSVSAQGGVTALLKLCTSGNEKGGEFVVPACGVLRNLAGVEEIKRFMVEEGAVSCFITLVRSKDEASQISGIELLQIIASRDESVRQMIIRGGGIQILVRVMDPKSSFSSKARETALRAIESLCFSSMSSLNILINCGFLDQLLYILRNGEVSVQELSVKVALRLSRTTENTNKSMGDAGFMPEFVRLLDMKSFEFREMAAEVLCNMVCIPRNRKRFMQENTNVEQILQLLDPEEVKSGNKFLLSILMSLTSCNSARRKIMKSGYVKNLEKLAEAEDIEAKKILRKLSTNRFRSILSGIWSS